MGRLGQQEKRASSWGQEEKTEKQRGGEEVATVDGRWVERKTEERPRLQTEAEEEGFGKMKDEFRKLEPPPLIATITSSNPTSLLANFHQETNYRNGLRHYPL